MKYTERGKTLWALKYTDDAEFGTAFRTPNNNLGMLGYYVETNARMIFCVSQLSMLSREALLEDSEQNLAEKEEF
jgi:hypothetical protein